MTLFDADKIVHNFSHLDEVFFHTDIPKSKGNHQWSVLNQPVSLPDLYSWQNEAKSLSAWLDKTSTTSLVVIKEGEIVYEDYRLDTQPNDPRISWSMAKSFLSALFGLAVDEGLIDIEKTVVEYLPEFEKTAYKDARVIDVLNMASGVHFDEDYLKFSSDINKMGRILALGGEMDEFALSLTQQARKPGLNRQYVSIDTHVLSMILRQVTGQSLQDYFKARLWDKLGSETASFYLTDGAETAFALGGINMTSRDYARFGQLFLQQGRWGNEQVIPAQWVAESTANSAPKPLNNSSFGYGYQWWIPPNSKESGHNDFTAGGIYGQFIYINPKHNVVIVKTSAHREFRDDGQQGNLIKHETMEMFRAIASSL